MSRFLGLISGGVSAFLGGHLLAYSSLGLSFLSQNLINSPATGGIASIAVGTIGGGLMTMGMAKAAEEGAPPGVDGEAISKFLGTNGIVGTLGSAIIAGSVYSDLYQRFF